MRLRKIRLAGFKSFVDPTTIPLPGDLIGVVGPNGCGKSNVIDAVRWVMGEISAKHLRGDSMADVVFTGSNTRQPVSQASVELVFDNSEGRLGGRFAAYTEISIKREVSRDTQSSYYLNGTRCRRRDVMDVFLGTGLGPRSYAIIEQGMISRVVEARPEDLRDFLEEAAGISRYKERRRETENRIRHTNENLDRLNDLREELGKRLAHLKRQATQAEKYKVFKDEERTLKAQIEALRWRELDQGATRQATQIAEQDNRMEAAVARQRQLERRIEEQRVEHGRASESFNDIYRKVLDAGAAIARSEETIQNLRGRREQLSGAERRERERLDAALAQARSEDERLAELARQLTQCAPQLERLDQDSTAARARFRSAEEAYLDWQSEGESINERAEAPSRTKHAEEARIEQLEQNLAGMTTRRTELEQQGQQGADASLRTEIGDHQQRMEAAVAGVELARAVLAERTQGVKVLRDRSQQHGDALHALRERAQQLQGRIASLEALQQAALGQDRTGLATWLEAQGLISAPRLAQRLQVQPGWENAVESALGQRLDAVMVDDLPALRGALETARDLLGDEGATFVDAAEVGAAGASGIALTPLMRHLQGPPALGALLAGVYAVTTLAEALAQRGRLAAHEFLVTPEGAQVGPSWLRLPESGGAQAGVLARERELQQLSEELDQLGARLDTAGVALQATRRELEQAEDEAAAQQRAVVAAQELRSELAGRLNALQARRDAQAQREAQRQQRLADLHSRIQAEEQVLAQARQRLHESSEQMQRISGERSRWEERRGERREQMESARDAWQQLRDEAHALGLRVQAMRSQSETLEEGRGRVSELIVQLQQRVAEMGSEQQAIESPLAAAEAALQQQLAERRGVEDTMTGARGLVERLETGLKELEQGRHGCEQAVQSERAQLERLRMEAQEVLVRRKTVEESLARAGTTAAAVLEGLEEAATLPDWEQRLEAMERRISRLGPINLAAIDEYEQQSERKTYLDSQHDDLAEALSTLQDAIQKIDRETRARFKETYEKVNDGLKRLFPRLFGGGQAELVMTGDDLLSTGISVTARPPGKRNTSIALLSGGEKALTAVALVFAIFGLNPAPFCLLDEVDAPLDDANVGRFCELVKEMSEQVQFLVVTHNKITMEIAQQLIGVTMFEPGVSRLVAVDIDQAVEMAAA
jgi:chromosome segregation protein